MSSPGKALRLARIFAADGRAVVIALDHGRRHGPISGLEDLGTAVKKVVEAGVDAVMVSAPTIRDVYPHVAGRVGLVARIDGTGSVRGPDETDDRLIASVKRACALGADAVSVMVYMGTRRQADNLEKLALVAEEAEEYGMPVMAEVVLKPPLFEDPRDPEALAYGARVVYEHGADIVKIAFSGGEDFALVTGGVPIPVLILGGPKRPSYEEVLEDVKRALAAGARGVVFGRNVFQQDDPVSAARKLVETVHKR